MCSQRAIDHDGPSRDKDKAMQTKRRAGEFDGLTPLDRASTEVLGREQERVLLRELADCKRKLAEALAEFGGNEAPSGADDPQAMEHFVANAYRDPGSAGSRLGAIARRCDELRSKLALANMRLVAHVAKRFRDRGISDSDLLQEGFCGLLEAIDRFDLSHETKLATYATWWIRQAIQRAVAAGAYPVRLTPRHLRQLAESQDVVEHAESAGDRPDSPPEMIRRIHAATRPTVSLDAAIDPEGSFSLLQTMSDPEGDRTAEVDTDEAIDRLMENLRPREQQVLALRFGLGGQPQLSLSQVGQALAVSKERVRQIQDRALEKLRAMAVSP